MLTSFQDRRIHCQAKHTRIIEKNQVHIQNFGGVASRVHWGWRDSYEKTGNFVRVGDKSMLKMYKKARVGREGDI